MYLEFDAGTIKADFTRAGTPQEVDAALKLYHIEPVDSEAHRRPNDPDEWPTWSGAIVFNAFGDPALWYRGTDDWAARREALRRLLDLLLDVPWPLEIVGGAIALWLDYQSEGDLWTIQVNNLGYPDEVRAAIDTVASRG